MRLKLIEPPKPPLLTALYWDGTKEASEAFDREFRQLPRAARNQIQWLWNPRTDTVTLQLANDEGWYCDVVTVPCWVVVSDESSKAWSVDLFKERFDEAGG